VWLGAETTVPACHLSRRLVTVTLCPFGTDSRCTKPAVSRKSGNFLTALLHIQLVLPITTKAAKLKQSQKVGYFEKRNGNGKERLSKQLHFICIKEGHTVA
jgi:hypothetical protein